MVQSTSPPPIHARRKLWIQVLAFVALVAVIYLKPKVEAWLEPRLEEAKSAEITQGPDDDGEWKSPISAPKKASSKSTGESAAVDADNEDSGNAVTQNGGNSPGRPSSVVKMDQPPTNPRPQISDPEKNNPPPRGESTVDDLRLGKLTEIRNNVFESTAGLIYLPGGAEGHRLKHVMQHANDNQQKAVHGVFDGDRDSILAAIDEAYTKAQKGGSNVREERQNDRQIYTVNLRRRVGQVGGSQGQRQGNPECRYLRLVLENDNEVVSAYPTKSF